MLSLLGKQWHERGKYDEARSLLENFLGARNFSLDDFPEANWRDLADPFLFQDMEKIVERIFAAIKKNERIMIFGDYDLDGMSSVAQVFKTLRHLGAEVSYRLPSRQDGYGLSEKYIAEAAQNDVQLFITTDCGISNIAEVEYANKQGMDVIITDHHSVPKKLPPAFAILHPLRAGETFPDKHITGAGVAFFLCFALLEKKFGKGNIQKFSEQLLESAALGTVADCGILLGQNRLITLLGIEALKQTQNPGLQQLFLTSGTDAESITAETIAFYLAPRLNVAGRLDHPHMALELLLGKPQRAFELETLNHRRQNMVHECVLEAEAVIGLEITNFPALVTAHTEWPAGVIGLIAGKLAEKYDRPTVILEKGDAKMVASCRGPEDFHFANVLKQIDENYPDLFLSYGGHAAAAGFSILNENFEHFQNLFREHVIAARGETPPAPRLKYDFALNTIPDENALITLLQCEPFGVGNPNPLFLFSKMKIVDARKVGKKENHLSLQIQDSKGKNFSAIFFQQAALLESILEKRMVDILARPEVRTWQGQRQIQLKIQDVR